jgi:hypothetical protein
MEDTQLVQRFQNRGASFQKYRHKKGAHKGEETAPKPKRPAKVEIKTKEQIQKARKQQQKQQERLSNKKRKNQQHSVHNKLAKRPKQKN